MSKNKIHRRGQRAPIPFAERLKYENLEPDLWFDPHLQLPAEQAQALLKEIGPFETRARPRGRAEERRHIGRFGAVAANALIGEHQDKAVACSLDNAKFKRSCPFTPEFLSSRPLVKMQKALDSTGFLSLSVSAPCGRHAVERSGASTYAATEAFLKAAAKVGINHQSVVDRIDERAVIHMKNNDKERIAYDAEHPLLKRREGVIRRFNAELQQHEIMTVCEKRDQPKRLNSSCYAVFNQGSAWHGGRIFGGLWQIEKSERRSLITIDGTACLEPDFPSFQPNVLYAMAGEVCDGDPYDIPVLEAYLVRKGVPLIKVRGFIKHAMVALINLRARQGRHWVDLEWNYEYDLSIGEVFNMIEARHPAITKYFCKSFGYELMSKEALIAECVIDQGLDQVIILLPVHDSFLVEKSHVEWLMSTMEKNYKEVIGSSIKVRIE